MLIAGIDYSLTSPSICVFNSEEAFCFKRCAFYFLSDVKKNQKLFMNNIKGEAFHDWNSDFSRYENISDWAMDYLTGCEQVAIEGYAFGAKGKVFHIAENTGVLKYRLHQTGIPVEVIPPSAVKKQASGKGNANKEEMYNAFLKETFVNLQNVISPGKKDIGNPVSDIVDSYFICKALYLKLKGLK
jgi:hypothetical protein